MRKKLIIMSMLAAVGVVAPAHAQWNDGWQARGGYGDSWRYRDRDGYRDDDNQFCSGARAHRLEDMIRHEFREGDIDRDTAAYLHESVDRTEDRQRDFCSNGLNYREAAFLDRRYDQIEQRLHAEEDRGRW